MFTNLNIIYFPYRAVSRCAKGFINLKSKINKNSSISLRIIMFI